MLNYRQSYVYSRPKGMMIWMSHLVCWRKKGGKANVEVVNISVSQISLRGKDIPVRFDLCSRFDAWQQFKQFGFRQET